MSLEWVFVLTWSLGIKTPYLGLLSPLWLGSWSLPSLASFIPPLLASFCSSSACFSHLRFLHLLFSLPGTCCPQMLASSSLESPPWCPTWSHIHLPNPQVIFCSLALLYFLPGTFFPHYLKFLCIHIHVYYLSPVEECKLVTGADVAPTAKAYRWWIDGWMDGWEGCISW